MSQQLLIIDSRDREFYDTTNPKNIKIVFDRPITFKTISLLAVDYPIAGASEDKESLYYVQIRELPIVSQGSNINDQSAFIIMRNSDIGNRTMQFANTCFSQFIDLGRPTTFTEFNIGIRYRKKSSDILQFYNDYTFVFAIS